MKMTLVSALLYVFTVFMVAFIVHRICDAVEN